MSGYIGQIQLTEDESALLQQIDFDPPSHDHDVHLVNSKRVAKLMDSLVKRNGMPQHRVSWFTDPDYKRGRLKGSRQEMFERNGTRGSEIFEHPNFLTRLRYLVFGAELPSSVVRRFSDFVQRYQPIGSDDVGDLLKLTKDLANEFRIQPHKASEEFFKLALDCGVHLMWAQYLDEHVGKMKLRKH